MPRPSQFENFRNRSFELRTNETARAEGVRRRPNFSSIKRIPIRRQASQPRTTAESDGDPTQTKGHSIQIDGLEFWVEGDNVLCACPDCAAPMTVRVWLGLADCWRCHCSLQLSAEVIEAVREAVVVPKEQPQALEIEIPAPRPRLDPQPVAIAFSAEPSDRAERLRELERLARTNSVTQLVSNFLASLPAWFISFLFHLILFLILALFVFQPPTSESISLVLSTYLDSRREEGGVVSMDALDKPVADNLLEEAAGEDDQDSNSDAQRDRADAAELASDPAPIGALPNLDFARAKLSITGEGAAKFAARDPRFRQDIVQREGGTTQTEAAVARGLRWLASVQNDDGSWSLAKYSRHERPSNKGDAAGTSLALLPFLGAGQTHEYGIYKQTVSRGLLWLMSNQKDDGDLRANFPGQAGMYAHGQAAICLCEAYALTGDERFREPAQKAIEFIQAAQHRQGGWRYSPGQEGDTSVFGWQLMALQSARSTMLGQTINEDTFRLADYYLDTASKNAGRSVPDGALYRYQPNDGPVKQTMTAEALLCRMYLGWKHDDPRLMYGIKWLLTKNLPSADDANLYYWYYGTQVMHHYGGKEWETWNRALRDRLVSMQLTEGRFAGSWDPDDFTYGDNGERIYTTAFAVCTLEVYYRHLPIFRKIDLD